MDLGRFLRLRKSMSDVDVLYRRIERERKARKEAEQLLEQKSRELFISNEELKRSNKELEQKSKRLSKALESIEMEYERMIQDLREIVFKINPDGLFTYINNATTSITGFSPNELIGRHFTELLTTESREEISDFYLDQIKQKEVHSYLQIPVLAKNKKVIWFGQSVTFTFNADGELIEGIAVARDITDVVKARQAISDSEEKYRGLIEGMELGILEVDNNGNIVKAYPWFCDMVGYSEDELLGKNASNTLLFPEDASMMKSNDLERKKGQTGVYEIRIRHKNGGIIWVAISAAPYTNAKGEIVGSIGVHLDITEQKSLVEKLETANAETQRARESEHNFFMNLSHEIRTPMNAIIGMSHLLSKTDLDPLQKSYLDDLMFSSNVLRGLISNILDFSRLERGDYPIQVKKFNLNRWFNETLSMFKYLIDEKSLNLIVTSEFPDWAMLESDSNILTQILLNLVGNATKYTEEGSVSVSLKAMSKPKGVQLIVTDTGVGISRKQISKIFDRFYQIDNSNSKGYGLGLSITKQLCDVLGSDIDISSELGHGTQVKVVFPLSIHSEKVVSDEFNSIEFKAELNVLVVEDNPMNQSYILALLADWGLKSVLAENLKEAQLAMTKEVFDLILLDMQLPDGSGVELAQYVREKKISSAIVAVTATSINESINREYLDCIDGIVSKPFVPSELLNEIGKQFPQLLNHDDSNKPSEDHEFVAMMVETFIQECPKLIDDLLTAVDAGDSKLALRELHKLPNMLHLIDRGEFAIRVKELESKVLNQTELNNGELVNLIEELEALIVELKSHKHND